MLCAIATDDGVYLMDRHFGDAVQYELYNIENGTITFKEVILNPFREEGDEEESEDLHGGKIKASNMKELFLEKGVSVLASKRFGPNITRMVKNFVPVIIRHDLVEKAKELLQNHYCEIEEMFAKGQERQPIILT